MLTDKKTLGITIVIVVLFLGLNCLLKTVLHIQSFDSSFRPPPPALVTSNSMLHFNVSDDTFSSSQSDDKCLKQIPQAFIIGIMKAGTTTMNLFLSTHPQVAAKTTKSEINYFSHHFNKPLSWYKQRLPCSYSNQITIEKSPTYFYHPKSASRIRSTIPNAKLILVVKDPIQRAESMFAMIKKDSETFEEAVTIRNNKNKLQVNTRARKLIVFSNYQKYIGAWLKNFKRHQIFIVDSRELKTNPVKILKEVERFFNIEPYFTLDMFVYNATKDSYRLKTNNSRAEGTSRPHEAYSSEVRKLLEDFFRPLNKKFFEVIQMTFDWGY